jgi:hypothetical protein
MGRPLALDGRRLMGGHNNQPKIGIKGGGGRWRGDATRAERVGGVLSLCSGRQIKWQKKSKTRGAEPRPQVAANQLKNATTN